MAADADADADVEALKDLILSTSFKLQINQKFQMRKDTNNANNTFDSGSEGGGGEGEGRWIALRDRSSR